VTLTGDAFTFIGTSNGMELTTAYLMLYRIEMSSNSIYTGRVTHEYYFIGQLFWLEMQMETRTICIDDEFGLGKLFVIHISI
jgi:hypothetical protein